MGPPPPAPFPQKAHRPFGRIPLALGRGLHPNRAHFPRPLAAGLPQPHQRLPPNLNGFPLALGRGPNCAPLPHASPQCSSPQRVSPRLQVPLALGRGLHPNCAQFPLGACPRVSPRLQVPLAFRFPSRSREGSPTRTSGCHRQFARAQQFPVSPAASPSSTGTSNHQFSPSLSSRFPLECPCVCHESRFTAEPAMTRPALKTRRETVQILLQHAKRLPEWAHWTNTRSRLSPAPRFRWTLICDKECQYVQHETSGFRARARSPEGD